MSTLNFKYPSQNLLVHLLVLLLILLLRESPVCALETHSLDRFEAEVQAYEAQDKKQPPERGCTLFIGSSTFTRWKSLEKDLRDLHAVNRGFGGSTIPEQIYYEKRMVAPYHPARIVFYAGTNDIAEGRSAKMVCDDFFNFVKAVHEDVPDAQIYFVSISLAPVRLSFQAEFDESNQCIANRIKEDPKVHFIDVRPEMRGQQGDLRADYFGPDRLHMTNAGYQVWTALLRKELGK